MIADPQATEKPTEFDINTRLSELMTGKPNLAQLSKIVSSACGELVTMTIAETDVRVRERIKKMLKGLLDFVAADTKYPPNQGAIINSKKVGIDILDEVT